MFDSQEYDTLDLLAGTLFGVGAGIAVCVYVIPPMFLAADFVAAVAFAGLLQLIRAKRNQTNTPPDEPDPDPATVSKQLCRYDRDMDDFWKEWRKATRH